MAAYRILDKAELPLEVVILLVAGIAILVAGVLLFPVAAGALPYYENGLYGLLLVMYALQTITLGKTPFGDMRRSRALLLAGSAIAATGIATCFVPDLFSRTPRLLLAICFGVGGLLWLLQMLLAKDKYRTWASYGGIFWQLIAACSAVYALSILIGLLVWQPQLLPLPATALVVLLFGTAIVYLALVLRMLYQRYPQAAAPRHSDVAMSTEQSLLLLLAMFKLLLGVLMIPVNLGTLPFAGSAQLGLLMVLFAVQMLASGNTPIGPFPRSRLMIVLGVVFAALGTMSCMIPNLLAPALKMLVGALNILGGVLALGPLFASLPPTDEPHNPHPGIVHKLFATQLVMQLLSILFGASVIFNQPIPGFTLGALLAGDGLVMLYLLHLLRSLDRMQRNTAALA